MDEIIANPFNSHHNMKHMTLREVQQVLLDILKEVHGFCIENDIPYSLSGGTLLGAIRHNGFIPWDDDVDIQIPRPDYDRFIRTYKSKRGYKLFSHEIEGGENVRIRLTKICDVNETFVDQGPYKWTNEDVGVAIDVIPVDGAPCDAREAKRHIYKLIWHGKLTACWRAKFAPFSEVRKYNTFVDKMKFVAKKILGYFVGDNCMDYFIEEMRKYDWETSEYFCASSHYGMGEWQPKSNMGGYELHRFEDAEFYVMSGYKENLRSLFGNYMQLPPESQRVSHDYNNYYWK